MNDKVELFKDGKRVFIFKIEVPFYLLKGWKKRDVAPIQPQPEPITQQKQVIKNG